MEHSQSPSTPSRHLHKRGGKQSQPQSRLAHKANWDSNMVRMFMQLVIKELDSGFKGSFHTMTMHGYRAIAKAFEERTHKVHEVKQLQNKYASLKKDWQSWSHLMDNRHGPTGISYNEATGLIQASDDWWAHYEKYLIDFTSLANGFTSLANGFIGKGESWDVGKPKSRKKTNDAVEETGCWVRLRSIGSCAVFLQDLKWITPFVASVLIVIDKNALKFKTKLLEHMELMRRVYEGAIATGKFAWTPGAAFEPVATEDNLLLVDKEDCEDSSGLPPFQPSAQHGQTVHHNSTQEEDIPVSVHAAASVIHADDTPTSGQSKRKFSRTTHS
ncbi:L10-interacting MYB domain-containing protein [Camellia lanceoleosa]|uniref:L10-interacting MYB domain-containing protein n=1 Tax=Camellia lanceoleosa TaxID=1840588 RepID=A0ACC0H2Z8_9ERIC|nr:L10-interacting MYB domain-containing protein [Camellia lanceoleosa]